MCINHALLRRWKGSRENQISPGKSWSLTDDKDDECSRYLGGVRIDVTAGTAISSCGTESLHRHGLIYNVWSLVVALKCNLEI